MDVSENSGFSPQIIHFNRVFHYKPSILGYLYFRKHPYPLTSLVLLSRVDVSNFPGNRWDTWCDPPLQRGAIQLPSISENLGQFVWSHTVDGWNCTGWYVVYPIIYKVYTSQVVQDFFHQQYLRFSRQFWMTGWTAWDRSGKVLKDWPFSTEPLTIRRKGNGNDEFSACLRSVQSRKQKVCTAEN